MGQPVRAISSSRFEYKAPDGIARLEIEYRTGSSVVDRLEVYFVSPISRAALIKKFNRPQQADNKKTNPEQKLVEYFGGSAMLALTYESSDAGSGVSQIGYYSRQLLASAAGIDVPAPNREMQLEDGFYLTGTNLTYYPKDNVEQCRADCANNPNCRAFTFIKAGTYNPGDSAMCYLVSAVTGKVAARGHISGIKE